MKTLLQISLLILFLNSNTNACISFDLGLLGTACWSDAVIEVEILNTKDSSDWVMYPNGFNHQEIYRLMIDCKILQSNFSDLKDSIRLTFSISSGDRYDSLGNYQYTICEDVMHSCNEFKLQKGEKYVFLIQKHAFFDSGKREWQLLRAEKMDYKKVLLYYQESHMIDKYLRNIYSRRLDRDFLQHSGLYGIYANVVQNRDSSIESILFYNPYSSKFALIKDNLLFESDSIVFDYSLESIKIKKKYYWIKSGKKWIKLKKENLQKKY